MVFLIADSYYLEKNYNPTHGTLRNHMVFYNADTPFSSLNEAILAHKSGRFGDGSPILELKEYSTLTKFSKVHNIISGKRVKFLALLLGK